MSARLTDARWVTGLGVIAALAALLFPFAPVQQQVSTYRWEGGPAAALPLVPYQPVHLVASWDCSAAAQVPPGGIVLSTVPAQAAERTPELPGLQVLRASSGRVVVTSGETLLADRALPSGECQWQLRSTPDSTEVLLDEVTVAKYTGDIRPAVAGLFSEVPAGGGLAVELTADTRFQTSPGPLKIGLAVVFGCCSLGALGLIAWTERRRRRVRLLPSRWWKPQLPDAAVVALLAGWTIIGPVTADDGYLAGIVRERGETGFVSDHYGWMSVPQAPFGWLYELYHLWAGVSPDLLWMRLPSTVLGLLCWLLLSRLVVPRLGGWSRLRWAPWLTALGFAAWWIPFNLGLRPEAWIAVGTLLVFCLVERAAATRCLLPAAIGLAVAAATAAISPAGLVAFAPFLAQVRSLALLVRHNEHWRWPAVLAVSAAACGIAVLLMFADQNFAAVSEATRVRQLLDDGQPWYAEYERYARLLDPERFEGALAKRAAVLLTLLAVPAVAWVLLTRRAELAAGPVKRLIATLLLCLAALSLTPDKSTQHFGELAGVGSAVLVAGIASWHRVRSTWEVIAGTAVLTAVTGLVLTALNRWPWVSDYGLPGNALPLDLLGYRMAELVLAAGFGLAFALAVAVSREDGRAARWPRLVPPPAAAAAVVTAFVVLFTVTSFAEAALNRRNTYTVAADNFAQLTGQSCGLADFLLVEPEPAQGELSTASYGGQSWFVLTPEQRSGELPVVLPATGEVEVEFGHSGTTVFARTLSPEGPEVRLFAPPGADSVRVVDGEAGVPRAPRLVPMSEVVLAGSAALLEQPVAFAFPCLRPAALPHGRAELPGWRIAPPVQESAEAEDPPAYDGPLAGARMLVTEQRVPVYLRSELLREPVQLYRWVPETATEVAPRATEVSVPAWYREGRVLVPVPEEAEG